MTRVRKPYLSDLSDEEWSLAVPYLVLKREDAEQRRHDLGELFNALPFLTVLYPSERYARERGRPHGKLTDRARRGLLQIARRLPGRRIIAVTDSSYASIDLLDAVRDRV